MRYFLYPDSLPVNSLFQNLMARWWERGDRGYGVVVGKGGGCVDEMQNTAYAQPDSAAASNKVLADVGQNLG